MVVSDGLVWKDLLSPQAFKIGTSRLSPAAFDCRIDYTVDGRKVEGVAFLKDSVRPVEKGSIPENMNGVPYMRRMVFTQMVRVYIRQRADNSKW